jgi:hypothetical protein
VESRRPHPALYRNWVSYWGGLLIVVGLALTFMGVLFQVLSKNPGPYSGIITFVVFPSPILVGIALVLGGMRRESLRRRRLGTSEARPYPALDLNDAHQRRAFVVVFVSGAALLAVLAATGYQGYEVTESVGFCGNTCHVPMGPQMTAYQDSPHARVPCVACHVGDGAGHYVASKLNGVKQLAGVVFNTYDRPIPSPVKALRPARDTCETCHWPKKFWGSTLYQRPLFLYDEANTPEQLILLLKVGGGEQASLESGTHWHMVVDNKIEFVAEDSQYEDIPWVKVSRKDGTTKEYFRRDHPVEPTRLPTMTIHTMDCIDCHNRPSHQFRTPDVAVDNALARGDISPTLPSVKILGVGLLSRDFPTSDAAHQAIREGVLAFYADKYADLSASRGADIEHAVEGLTRIFDRNSFPSMRVSWRTYPDNIGHRNSPGCFRCHDGRHAAADGSVITHECDACHSAPERSPLDRIGEIPKTADAEWHPWQLPQKYLEVKEHKSVLCHECHLAGRKPKTECNECHGH